MAVTKRNTFRVYLNEDDTALMQKIAGTVDLGQSELMSKLMTAALRAVKENNYRFSLPLKLHVGEDLGTSRLNEPAHKPVSRK